MGIRCKDGVVLVRARQALAFPSPFLRPRHVIDRFSPRGRDSPAAAHFCGASLFAHGHRSPPPKPRTRAQGVEKLVMSKMMVPHSNRRIYTVDKHAGIVRAFLLALLVSLVLLLPAARAPLCPPLPASAGCFQPRAARREPHCNKTPPPAASNRNENETTPGHRGASARRPV